MSAIYEDLVDGLTTSVEDAKLVVKLVLYLDTGNVPYEHVFHEMYVTKDVRANFQICGIDGFLAGPPFGKIGENIDILYRGLVHMCSHQELYVDNLKVYLPTSYRKSVSMLASFIYECQKYPNAHIEAHYIPSKKEVNVVSE